MIPRIIGKTVLAYAKKLPVVALLGPRQSGKTTLVKALFPKKPYVTLEDYDRRTYATEDPRGFLQSYEKDGAIFDEIQRVPSLLSYLQSLVDRADRPGYFILTGSQNFLFHENLAQSLAGRVALTKLLPLSLAEVQTIRGKKHLSLENILFQGGYPRLYDKKLLPPEWFPSYIETYLDRDVRVMKNIGDLHSFQKFMKLCAGRVGQLLNLSSLGADAGISHNTAKSWLSILEASYILFLLQPHHKNFKKRLVKMPKLYFYDTGLLCALLGIDTSSQLITHYLRGAIFESFVISEIIKNRLNEGKTPRISFWRDKVGHEIDLLLETADSLIPVEIKAGKTIGGDYFQNLQYWSKLAKAKYSFLIYGGEESQKRTHTTLLSWRKIAAL